jgi:hypothetical protein
MTGVPIDKMKLMYKGRVVKEGVEWSSLQGFGEGVTMQLIGTQEDKHLKEAADIKFLEDLSKEEKAKILKDI